MLVLIRHRVFPVVCGGKNVDIVIQEQEGESIIGDDDGTEDPQDDPHQPELDFRSNGS